MTIEKTYAGALVVSELVSWEGVKWLDRKSVV